MAALLCLLAAEPELCVGMPAPQGWLTPSEQARWQSFGTEARRNTFVAGRWLARRAVQQWLAAAELPALEVADSGACRVAGRGDVFVSISHSGGSVACAAAGVPVGVDLESPARPRDHLALAQTVHSLTQQAGLAALPAGERAEVFLKAWTIKEAWLKAREQGLDFALMRGLEFDDDVGGDVAVTALDGLVLAVACNPQLPSRIQGPTNAVWRRCRTRTTAT